ncbi:hypothetical protein AMTR_s00008p00165370 [Amborella trichopoda]|uniref:14-3-3 domain-containing protein n=1 Tax=Amborella trichopoda TaxID=13333 RepID=W1NHS1_AMBTC|nr:hypothetical protein AMTR_s00008p00165370 [Amborella trichopoda]
MAKHKWLARLTPMEKTCQILKSQIFAICRGVHHLLYSYLLPYGADSPAANVFYLKMKADFYEYLAQLKDDNRFDNSKRTTDEAHLFYQREILDATIDAFELANEVND